MRLFVDEARARLRLLAERGASEQAFTFRQVFPPPGQDSVEAPGVEAEFCGTAEGAD